MVYMLISALICCVCAGIGASIVFFVKKTTYISECFMHAFSAGIMLASGVFSLLVPALDYCRELNIEPLLVFFLCFFTAGMFFYLIEYRGKKDNTNEVNVPMLITGVAIHNIPEGLCLGVAFASAVATSTNSAITSAIIIAVGVGIQNIPEGSSVAFPLRSRGMSKVKSFLCAICVALIESLSCILSYLIGTFNPAILPIMLTFAGAIMIISAVSDLLPIAFNKNSKIAFLSMLMGFLIMMSITLIIG